MVCVFNVKTNIQNSSLEPSNNTQLNQSLPTEKDGDSEDLNVFVSFHFKFYSKFSVSYLTFVSPRCKICSNRCKSAFKRCPTA